jgi:elongation factor P
VVTTQEFRNGFAFKMDGGIFTIVEFQHVKPGKGGAFVRTKVKNIETGAVLERTFRSGDKIDDVRVERHDMQFLYNDGTHYVLMDTSTYEQLYLDAAQIGDDSDLMKENEIVTVVFGDEKPLGIELPFHVDLRVVDTDPGVKGDTATGGTKPAKLESGASVQVPLFIAIDEIVRVDTRTREYLSRVN